VSSLSLKWLSLPDCFSLDAGSQSRSTGLTTEMLLWSQHYVFNVHPTPYCSLAQYWILLSSNRFTCHHKIERNSCMFFYLQDGSGNNDIDRSRITVTSFCSSTVLSYSLRNGKLNSCNSAMVILQVIQQNACESPSLAKCRDSNLWKFK
jgi:hypothetical protein